MARPCGRYRGDLSGYVDGTLPPKRVETVRGTGYRFAEDPTEEPDG